METLAAQGSIVTDDKFSGTAKISLTGGNAQTLTIDTLMDGLFTVNKSGGAATLAAALDLNGTGQDFTITAGTFDLAGFDLTV